MRRFALAGLLAMVPTAYSAYAQQPAAPEPMNPSPSAADSVLDRTRPDYDPLGIRLGGFILSPALSIDETWDDNILYSQTGRISDFITTILPSVDLKSNWNNHALNLHADGALARYADHGSEDTDDYNLTAGGRLDITHDSRLLATVGYHQLHEPRYSPNDLDGVTPTVYDDMNAQMAFEKEFARLSFRVDGTLDRYSYDNLDNKLNQVINEDLRDETQAVVGFRTGYELVSGRTVYIAGNYNTRSYEHTADFYGYDRNSHGYLAGAGAVYDLTGVTSVDLFAGYREQDYKDLRIGSLAGPTGAAKIIWNITRLTSVTATLQRDIYETILPNTAGYFGTQANIALTHELLRNLILGVSVGYEEDAFNGVGRVDDTYVLGASARYLMNRNFSLLFNYAYRTRGSTTFGNDFSENSVGIRLSAHM